MSTVEYASRSVFAKRVTAILLTLSAAAAIGAAGCNGDKTVRVATAPTQPATWSDLAGTASAAPTGEYRIAVQQPTQGLLPASLAVVRIAHRVTEKPEALVLDMIPDVDFLAWNSAFDDLRVISEVFPLNCKGMNGMPPTVENILDSAAAMKARLCLIFTEHGQVMESTELRGALYDVPGRRLIATMAANSATPGSLARPCAAAGSDMRDESPQWRARRLFESRVRACLLDLVASDQPVVPTAPEGWISPRRFEPVLWLPEDDVDEMMESIPRRN